MQTGLYLWVEGSLGKEMEIVDAIKANAPDAEVKTYLLAEDKPRYVTAAGGKCWAYLSMLLIRKGP